MSAIEENVVNQPNDEVVERVRTAATELAKNRSATDVLRKKNARRQKKRREKSAATPAMPTESSKQKYKKIVKETKWTKKPTKKTKTPKKMKLQTDIRAIKMSFKRAFRIKRDKKQHTDPEHARVHAEIEKWVIVMTKFAKLGSLHVHFEFMRIMATKTPEEIVDYFDRSANRNFFTPFFRATQLIGMTDDQIQANGNISHLVLNPAFKQMCERKGIAAPVIAGYSSVINYATQLYHTNSKNNIWMHARSRMKWFCQYFTNNKTTINNTLHYLFFVTSDKVPDRTIVDAIRHVLQPIDFHRGGRGYFARFKMEDDDLWLRYVPLFIRLQRFIREINHDVKIENRRRDELNLSAEEKKQLEKLPKWQKNFIVVPQTSFKRHHQ